MKIQGQAQGGAAGGTGIVEEGLVEQERTYRDVAVGKYRDLKARGRTLYSPAATPRDGPNPSNVIGGNANGSGMVHNPSAITAASAATSVIHHHQPDHHQEVEDERDPMGPTYFNTNPIFCLRSRYLGKNGSGWARTQEYLGIPDAVCYPFVRG